MKTRIVSFALALLFITLLLPAGRLLSQDREHIAIPDIPGYTTLKCDFHMHTVFSDGNVWPTVRADEIWLEGLDGFAITDHIEYLPYKADVAKNFNRSCDIARPRAERLGLIIIRGAEITRDMPPGHLNAIFLKDADPLETPEWRDAIGAAAEQNAFIMWNHPGWTGQQPDGVARWYPEHTELLEKGWMHGVEIVNGHDYYPEVHRWAIEKKLTVIGNSDVHSPIHMSYDLGAGERRPMTLVFARSRDAAGIREALFERRTAVYWDDRLFGEERYLMAIFLASVEILNPEQTVERNRKFWVRISNSSDIPFELRIRKRPPWLEAPEGVTLAAHRTTMLEFKTIKTPPEAAPSLTLDYEVTNLVTMPGRGLDVALPLTIQSGGGE